MKRIFITALAIAALAVFLAGPTRADAQVRLTLKNQATYVNSQIDTILITSQKWTAASNIWIRGVWGDTVDAVQTFAARIKGETAWTAVTAATDSVDYANTGSYYKGYTLRSPTIDRFAGLEVEWRIINTHAATGNGFATDNKYDLFWWIRN